MKRWSIAGRMTAWFAGTTASLILLTAGLSGWFLYQSVGRELDALAKEELDEARAMFLSSDRTPDEFREIAVDLAGEHPANPLAWRIWEANGDVWLEAGRTELLEQVQPSRSVLDHTVRPGRGLRWRVEPIGERRVGVILDGSVQTALLRRYGVFSMVLAAVSSLLAWLVAATLARRTARMLRLVADRTRLIREPRERIAFDGADLPEEVGDIVDALVEMLEKIRTEAERADLMTAGLAHELRSPIQNLMGEADVALLRERDAGEYRRVIESQLEELHELGRAVDNLVTLCSRREPGDPREPFDLGAEAELRMGEGDVVPARRGVRVQLDCSGDLRLFGDREALLLALRNLVSNGVEWSPDGGLVQVSVNGRGDEVEITVRDEGPGIPEEARERVFEPFEQGPSKHGRRVGFGLGLALARAAVETQGGSIRIADADGGGALLHVVLPRRKPAAGAATNGHT